MSARGAGSPTDRARRRGVSRRRLLRLGAALAGAPWLAACTPHRGRRGSIEGAIVGASHGIGHRLRGDRFPPPAARRSVPVVVVGAGVAGLSAGWKLVRSGFGEFEILELEPEPGGKSRAGRNEVSAFPWGAHYLPVPTRESVAVRELLAEMGLVRGDDEAGEPVYDERHLGHAPQERLWIHGRWQDGLFPRLGMGPDDARDLDRFLAIVRRYRRRSAPDAPPRFAIPVDASADEPELRALDAISMAAWLDEHGLRSERLRWWIDYACRDDYGARLATTSAWAGLHYFCSRPSEDPDVLTWPEGNGRLVEHLLGAVGPRVRCGVLVHRIDPRPAGGGVVVDALDVATETTFRIEARAVVYALPRFTAPRIVEGYPPEAARGFHYSPWVVANLTVDDWPAETYWDNVIYRSASLGYVVATHQSLRTTPGPTVLTYYRPFADGAPEDERAAMLRRSWADWVGLVLDDLRAAHPDIDGLVRRVDVMLWGHGMVRPVPGFVWGEARRAAREPFGPVHFAHSDMSGLSLFEEAQARGVAAAEAVLRRLGAPFSSSLGAAR